MTDPEQDKLKHNSAGSGIGQPQAGPSDVSEGKPQGRGFHKPSQKHTLEEVLKSLQDLIHNDLLRDAARGAGSSPATAGHDTMAPAETAPLADMPFGSVVKSLEELVAKNLAVADDDLASKEAPERITPEPESPATSPAKKPDSTQQAFGFDDWDAPPAEPAASETPMESTDTADFDTDTPSADAEAAPSLELEIPTLTESVAPDNFTADDIPVLEDIAAAGKMSTAHEIAERVVARLNAERQARGEPALDAGVLDALRALLREELERNPPGKQDGPE